MHCCFWVKREKVNNLAVYGDTWVMTLSLHRGGAVRGWTLRITNISLNKQHLCLHQDLCPTHSPPSGKCKHSTLFSSHSRAQSNTTLTAHVMQNQFWFINNSYSANICTARKMDGSIKEKKWAEIVSVAAGAQVKQQAPRNQFSHRNTIRILRNGMTECVCVCVFT